MSKVGRKNAAIYRPYGHIITKEQTGHTQTQKHTQTDKEKFRKQQTRLYQCSYVSYVYCTVYVPIINGAHRSRSNDGIHDVDRSAFNNENVPKFVLGFEVRLLFSFNYFQ